MSLLIGESPLLRIAAEPIEVNSVNCHLIPNEVSPLSVTLSQPTTIMCRDSQMHVLEQKILRYEGMLNSTRRELKLPEYDMALECGIEKQDQESEKKDSAVTLSKTDSRHDSAEDETAGQIDNTMPDLNAVNEKLRGNTVLNKDCVVEPSIAAVPFAPLKTVFQNTRSELEGIPHVPNAPKIPSVDGIDSGKAKNTGADGAQAPISGVEDQRERAILEARVRPDGLSHFISVTEMQALKSLGIERIPIVVVPEKDEKQGRMLKLKLWSKEIVTANSKNEKKEGKDVAIVTSKEDTKHGEKNNNLTNLAKKLKKVFHNFSSVA